MTTVLLTLGRLPKALDLARGFKALGCRVLVAEPYRWHLARVSSAVDQAFVVTAPNTARAAYLDDLLAIIAAERVDVVVPVSEEALHAVHLADRLPAGVLLNGPAADQLTELHDKLRFNQLARRLGLAAPETALLGTAEAADLAHRGRVITKPVLTCSGKGFRLLADGEALPAPTPTPTLVQAFVPGQVHSTFSVVQEGQVRATLVYTGAVFSGTVAVCFRQLARHPAIEDWVARFAEATRYSGFLSFDFIVPPGGAPSAIECNPRVTSGIHFLEAADVARAVLAPEDATPIRRKPHPLMQQFWACLTEVQASVGKPGFAEARRALLAAKDVTWDARDPLPLLTMPITSFSILYRALMQKRSFGDVATDDIAWFGDQQAT
jgi:hypothetical protein